MNGQKFDQEKWNRRNIVFVAVLSIFSLIAALMLLISKLIALLAGGG